MTKSLKHAVSVVIQNKEGQTLFCMRNEREDSFPLVWSLPSHFVASGESFDETIARIGRNKLGVKLRPVRLLHEGKAERENFVIFMHDYLAEVVEGTPHITETDPYAELKWEHPEKQLKSMTVMGDCCRLYKEYLGL